MPSPRAESLPHLQVVFPLLLGGQQCVQHGPQPLLAPLVLAADDVAECAHAPEEFLVQQVSTAPAGQVGQVQVDGAARGPRQPTGTGARGSCGEDGGWAGAPRPRPS